MPKSSPPNDYDKIEHIFLQVDSNGTKMFLGCIYRPKRNILYDTLLLPIIEMFSTRYIDVVIAGVLNCNILKQRNFEPLINSIELSSEVNKT